MIDRDACERGRETSRQRHGRVRERGGRREPIGCRDRQTDKPRHRLGCVPHASQNCQQQGERSDGLREPLRRATSRRRAYGERRKIEHQVSHDRSCNAARTLHGDIRQYVPPWRVTSRRKDEGDGGIEMCPGYRAKDQDQNDEDRTGRNRVAQERDRLIAPRQPLGHDPGTDNGGNKDGCAQGLREKAAADHAAESLELPMESSCLCSESLSSERSGKLTNREIRLESIRKASANANRILASLPVAAAGSGTPQCAVIGWPGQNGHASPAAL